MPVTFSMTISPILNGVEIKALNVDKYMKTEQHAW